MATHQKTVRQRLIRRTPGTLIEFNTDDGLRLHGFLMRTPVHTSFQTKCVIYIHGMGGNFYRHPLPFVLANAAAREGFAFFSMNTRGHDAVAAIYSSRKKKKMMGGTNLEKFEDCVFDIKGAIRALRTLGFKKFILCGHSTGCQKITFYQHKAKDRSVAGIVLLAPADDYNLYRKTLGRMWKRTVSRCKALARKGKGNETEKDIPSGFSVSRFLSITDLKRVESRIFNYDGPMNEFRKIQVPILVMFGSDEQYAVKPVREYLDLLKEKTHSTLFRSAVVDGGNHSFVKREDKIARLVTRWLRGIK